MARKKKPNVPKVYVDGRRVKLEKALPNVPKARTLSRVQQAFGFVVKSPHHWQAKIYRNRNLMSWDLVDYWPTTSKIMFRNQIIGGMSWPVLARWMGLMQRRAFGFG